MKKPFQAAGIDFTSCPDSEMGTEERSCQQTEGRPELEVSCCKIDCERCKAADECLESAESHRPDIIKSLIQKGIHKQGSLAGPKSPSYAPIK